MKVQRQLMDVTIKKQQPISPDTDHRFGAILDGHNLQEREANRRASLERRPTDRRSSDNMHTAPTSTQEEREAFVRDLTPVNQSSDTTPADASVSEADTPEDNAEETAAYYGYAATYAYQADTTLDLTEGLFYQKLAIESLEAVADVASEQVVTEAEILVEEVLELTPVVEDSQPLEEGITAKQLIADTLDMSEDDAYALLEKLDTPTKDYATHLAEPTVQRQVVQTYYNVDSPVELLSIAEAPEMLAKLDEAVANTYIVAEPDTQMLTELETPELASVTDIAEEQPQGELLEDGEADPDLAGQANFQPGMTPTVTMEGAAPVPTSSFEQALDKSIFDQIKGQVKLTEIGAGSTEIRIALTPESLGEVQARILTQNGVITAQFVAQSQRVREIIESNMAQLKEELEEKGIQIGELSVTVQQDSTDPQETFQQERQKSANRINDIINNIAAEFDTPEEILEDGVTISARV